VNLLSNLLGLTNVPPAQAPVGYRLATPGEINDGLALILGAGGVPAPARQVQEFLEFCRQRGVDPRGLWVVAIDGKLVWAMLPMVSPGRTALLFTPSSRPLDIPIIPLIDLACDHLSRQKLHLAQVLLDPADTTGRELYAANGFQEMAELLYLSLPITRSFAAPTLAAGWSWTIYSRHTHGLFAQVILESYRQSLDCPLLNGLRDIDDIIAGHKAAGEFDPGFWFVLSGPQGPVGVLLLCRVPRSDTAELVYLGLVPPARRQGISDRLMQQALWAARQMNLARLTLAVDAQNGPALSLYYRHGMQRFGGKSAMMRDLRPGAAGSLQ
jgi:ribosomal protein S18 acetylase RimI-like enzyme